MNPLVNELFDGVKNDKLELKQLSRGSGVSASVLLSWRKDERNPRLDLFLAVAETAGFEVTLNQKKTRILPTASGCKVMHGNDQIAYVDHDVLYVIDADGYANEAGTINHKSEIIGKIEEWRNGGA